MKEEEILEKLSQVIKKTLETNKFDLEMNIENTLEWDSLKHLQLITEIEEKFNIQLEFEDAMGMTSTKAMYQTIKRYTGETMLDKTQLYPHQQINKKIDFEHQNTYDLFKARLEKNPDKTLLIFPGKTEDTFTYKQYHQAFLKTAAYLKSKGLEKGDRIAVIFQNSPEFMLFYYAGLSTGITIIAINPDIATEEIQYILNDSKPKAIFYHTTLKDKINPLKTDALLVSINDLKQLEKLTDHLEPMKPNNQNPSDEAVIIYTSGTTGNPKGVILTQLNIISDAKAISEWFQLDENTRTLCILPLFHNNGQIATFMTPLYAGGSTVIVKGKASIMSFWGLVEKYRINWTSVMPSILAILLSIPIERKDNTMQGIICGGQVLTQTIQNEFEERFKIPIFEGYGLTETTSFSCFNTFPKEKRKQGSIGLPFLVNEMTIMDENDKELKPNKEGEICIRGYNVTKGYLNKLEKNKDTFKNGWFHSGDFGYKDEKGNYYIKGRKDSLIIKGGENIYPAELENVFFKHPKVAECAVIGIPDKLLGQELCAFIQLKEGQETTEEELKEYCKGKIAKFKQPKKIIIINKLEDLKQIPKTPTQKVVYRKLKEYYEKRRE